MIEVSVGGSSHRFLDISEMAEAIGRKRKTILRYERDNIMPKANYRVNYYTRKTGKMRIYSEQILVPKLVYIFKDIDKERIITDESIERIFDAFREEKEYFNKHKK